MGRNEHEGKLQQPVEEVRDHSLGRDTCGVGKSIRDRGVAGPDGREHTGDTLASVDALHAEPEEREDSSRYDAEVGQPVAVGGADGDGEGDVEVYADCTVLDISNAYSGGLGLFLYPLRTVGIALHIAATKVTKMASVADRPVATTLAAADHPAAVTRSENQYQVNDQPDQVCFSTGTGS